jgi:hypothetical protein
VEKENRWTREDRPETIQDWDEGRIGVQRLWRPSESRDYRGKDGRPSEAVVLRIYCREERATLFITGQATNSGNRLERIIIQY